MTVFVYDNTKIDQFTTFQAGDITVGSVENIDYGDINQTVEPERDENFFFVNDHGLITATADVLPFGPINVVDGRDALGRSRSQWIPENANTVLFDVNDSALESAVSLGLVLVQFTRSVLVSKGLLYQTSERQELSSLSHLGQQKNLYLEEIMMVLVRLPSLAYQ